jgi:hypothetical protein
MSAASTVAAVLPEAGRTRGRRVASIDIFRGLTMMVCAERAFEGISNAQLISSELAQDAEFHSGSNLDRTTDPITRFSCPR